MSANSIVCPKCGHARAAGTAATTRQCPACGVAYTKYRAHLARARKALTPPGPEDAAPAYTFDGSIWSLVGANLLAIGVAIYEGWGMLPLMALYWGQSVVIGGSNFFRILSLERFTTENLKMNDRPVKPTPATKRQVAVFFALHYGIFHFVYLMFLGSDTDDKPLFDSWFWLCMATFAVNHFWSYRYNREIDRRGIPNLGTLMFTPYIRIVPMHLTIIFGSMAGGGMFGLLLFGLLKTAADVAMHVVEHAQLQKHPHGGTK